MLRSIILTLLSIPGMTQGAVSLFQVETFDAPTDWRIGRQNLGIPFIRADSGPGGTEDFALQTSSSVGGGPGSRLVIFNRGTWAGDYSSQGISSLSLDLRNTGGTDLFIRIAVNGGGGWFVTDGQEVSTGLGYANYLFGLSPSDLEPASTRGSLGSDIAATLAAVSEVRILHSRADNSALGEVTNATLRIDNITAIPEPKTPLILSALLFFLIKRKR